MEKKLAAARSKSLRRSTYLGFFFDALLRVVVERRRVFFDLQGSHGTAVVDEKCGSKFDAKARKETDSTPPMDIVGGKERGIVAGRGSRWNT